MPPDALDKRFKDLQDRLTALQDATSQLQELIDRLANFNFQPGSVPLATTGEDDNNVASELSTEINQILREQEEDLELLQEEIVDIRPGRPGSGVQHDKDRLKDGAARLGQELQSCRRYFRKAQIAAKRNLELAQRQERELLYASFSSPRSGASSPGLGDQQQLQLQLQQRQRRGGAYKSTEKMSKEDQLVSASHDVTQSLRQTHDLMASELSRSEFAHRTLKESTRALAELSESYSSLDSLLTASRDLLGTLFRSQKSDTWYLETSFYLLLATIAWLVFRRWLYGPLWWLVWLPLKLVFRGAVGVGSSVARRGAGGVVDYASDPAAVSSSVLQQARMNSEGAPTIQVAPQATPSQQGTASGQEESMVEEVGKVIDESQENAPKEGNSTEGGNQDSNAQGETVLRERTDDEPPNPKKRMMEGEAPGDGAQERTKDEL